MMTPGLGGVDQYSENGGQLVPTAPLGFNFNNAGNPYGDMSPNEDQTNIS